MQLKTIAKTSGLPIFISEHPKSSGRTAAQCVGTGPRCFSNLWYASQTFTWQKTDKYNIQNQRREG